MKENFFNPKPKLSNIDIEYKKKQDKLFSIENKIGDNLDQNLGQESLKEKDKIRLTRVLQLIDRYKPEYKLISESENKLFEILKELYRFLPKRKEKEKPFIRPNDNPYLLAEEAIEALRKLRQYDYAIKNLEEGFQLNDEILKEEISGEIISQENLDTSLTLEYEKKNWGLDRICLDGMQNHLRTDSGGEKVWAQCKIEGEWVSLEEANNQKEKITEVRFADDGVGFDVKNLVLFWSSKSDEKESRGQFGEGLKMVAASSVRENLGMELQSQNWRAVPFGKKIEVNNTRKNVTQKVEQLSFDVSHYDQEKIIGSRTIFHTPSKEFIEEVLKLNDKVLELSKDYKPIFSNGEMGGQIVNKEEGNIFVKGIFIKKENCFFSYNFNNLETNRDRNAIVNSNLSNHIFEIIDNLNDKRLIKTLLQKSLNNKDAIECNNYYMRTQYPSLWKEAFYECFGENACLKTNFEIPDVFKKQEDVLRKMELTDGLFRLLKNAGVKTEKESLPSYKEIIPTSITLEYGKDIWGEERIMLDAIQNHLPQDAEGGNLYLRFKTKDGQWNDFNYFKEKNYNYNDIETIKIANEGNRGYDSRLLGIFQSMKDSDQSSGKWGEGLKMLSAACLRGGNDLTLKSRNWRATPQIQEQEIDDKKIQQLVFDVIHDLKEIDNNNDYYDGDYHSKYEQSATIFNNPTPALIEQFIKADEKVLELCEKNPIAATINGDILSLKNGELFVRGILIPGDHQLMYSYHFPKFDIKTRDRNSINKEDLQKELAELWSEIRKPEVIKDFLYQASMAAKNGKNELYTEFQTRFNPVDPDLWVKVYKDIFGENTSVRNLNSQNFSEVHQLAHVGLDVVTMPNKIFLMLQGLQGSNGEKISNYEDKIKELTDVNFVDNETLTNEEKKTIELLYKLDEFLPNNKKLPIKIYDRKYIDQKVALGFTDGSDISLLREILKNMIEAVDVYYHEKTHTITGSQDADAGFRNFLTRALAELALKQLEQKNKLNK